MGIIRLTNFFTKSILIMVCALSSTSAYAIKSYRFTTNEPQLVLYPNQYHNTARKKKSRLNILAEDINQRSQQDVIEFVKIALHEMVLVYQEESIRAKENSFEVTEQQRSLKLLRWSQDALAFANQLEETLDKINAYSDVQLFSESPGELYFLINNKPVIISSPVLNEQKTLEERIILSTCGRFYCDLDKLEEKAGPEKRNILVNAGWKLKKEHYIFYTESGLNFVFQTISQKKYKQRVCIKIARDLNLIASVLKDVKKAGVFIDWEYLYIQVIPGSNLYELIVNQFKDAVHLELEAIQYLNDFPEVTIPWLKERLRKEKKEFYFHKAEKLIKELAEK